MAEPFDLVKFMDRAEWTDDANCRGLNPEIFFPSRGADVTAIKSICRACDVQAECLAYALNNGEHHGIWGGMSEKERLRIRRAAAGKARGPIPPPSELARHEHGTTKGYRQHRYRGTEPCDACKHALAIEAHYERPSRASVTA